MNPPLEVQGSSIDVRVSPGHHRQWMDLRQARDYAESILARLSSEFANVDSGLGETVSFETIEWEWL